VQAIGIHDNLTILRDDYLACNDSFDANESCHFTVAWGSEYILWATNLTQNTSQQDCHPITKEQGFVQVVSDKNSSDVGLR
jgi:hypothetical protein